MRDFIITSLQTWDIEIGSTIKNTALEISKQNRVLYINTPMDISIRLRGNRQSPSYIRRMAVIKGEFTAPANQRQHVGAGLSFHVIFGQLPACTAFQYRQQKKQCPYSPMDCRAGCRARFQELHPPHRYGHLPQPLSEGVHPSGYQHLLPARLRHRRSLLAQARHPS